MTWGRTLIILVPALALAGASLVHASSEASPLALGAALRNHTALSANSTASLADRAFRAQVVRQTQGGDALAAGAMSAPAAALAEQAFAVDPVEASTLRSIALGIVAPRNEERGARAMELVAATSKRDTLTNIWLAQKAGQAGDFAAMVANLDLSLRSSNRAREVVLKPLVELLARPESHAPVSALLAADPDWEADFWREFVRNPVSVAAAAQFFRNSRVPLAKLTADNRAELFANLRGTGAYADLFALAALDPQFGDPAADLTSGRFVAEDRTTPLGWRMNSDGRFAARVVPASGELQIDARSDSQGLAAERVVAIDRPHSLTIRLAQPLPADVALAVTARCAEGDAELGSVDLGPDERSGEVRIVPGACRFITLGLAYRNQSRRRDALIQIASIALRPI